MLRTGITVDCASSGVILRLALQRPLCNLCREVYNETKAEYFLSVFAVALLAEGVDRNLTTIPTRTFLRRVALLAEGVDRNIGMPASSSSGVLVALLAEGVDRNTIHHARTEYADVALLAEGVDRNADHPWRYDSTLESPSSRRAWIEINISFISGSRAFSRPPRGGRG